MTVGTSPPGQAVTTKPAGKRSPRPAIRRRYRPIAVGQQPHLNVQKADIGLRQLLPSGEVELHQRLDLLVVD